MAKEVTTAVTQQLVNPIPAFPIDGSTASWIGFGTAAMIAAAFQLRRWASKSNLGADADASAQKMLALSQEREGKAVADTREAYRALNAQERELGELRSTVKFLTEALERERAESAEIRRGVMAVGQRVDAMKGRMEDTTKKLGNSGIAPLNKE